jgi:hypothetical protein
MSTAEVRRRYKREVAAAQQLFDPPVLPPAMQMEEWQLDMRCDRCRVPSSCLYKQPDGSRVRRCERCEEAKLT